MNSNVIVITGNITNVEVKSYLKDNQNKELIKISMPYDYDVIVNQDGSKNYVTKFASFILPKNDFSASLKKGDIITVTGQLKVKAYKKQDGNPDASVEIKNPKVVETLDGDKITKSQPVQNGYQQPQGQMPQGNPYGQPQGQNPYQGYNNPQYGQPQGNPYQQGYGQPQGNPYQGNGQQGVQAQMKPQGQGQNPYQGYNNPQYGQPQGQMPQGNPYQQGYGQPQGNPYQGNGPEISDDDLPF